MQKFLIERQIPGAGAMSAADLRTASKKSCGVLRDLGPNIQWVESYVTDDRLFCVYLANDAEIIREHAKRGGFAADSIRRVHHVIDPTTAGLCG